MGMLDTAFIGPGLLFLNQYFDTFVNELLILWICFVSQCDYISVCVRVQFTLGFGQNIWLNSSVSSPVISVCNK